MLRRLTPLLLACLLLTAAVTPGHYSGTWSGSLSGSSGKIDIRLKSGDGSEWKGEVSFSFEGSDVQTKVKSVKVNGDAFAIVYDFNLAGASLESSLEGKISGKTLEGKYTTRTVDDGSKVDEGSWSAALTE